MTLSTHVLDSVSGRAAAGVPVALERRQRDGGWTPVTAGVTDDDGRLRDWVPPGTWGAGDYRLVFDTGAYFAGRGVTGFFPQVVVVFTIAEPDRHHHVPLLLAPYSYTTYRGT